MTRQYGDQESNIGERQESVSNSELNFGSARSDYGSYAYGGRLDEAGLRGESDISVPRSRSNRIREVGGQHSRRGGAPSWTGNGMLMLVGGLGLGGAIAYLLGSKASAAKVSSARGKEMMVKCGEVMTKEPACCLPSDTVVSAAGLMRAEDVGPVLVVSDHQTKNLVGIVTDRDLALKVVADARDPKGTRVFEVMTTGVSTCRPQDDLQKALDLMEEHQVRRIAVVDEGNRVVGIIAQADVATRVEAPEKTAALVEEVSRASAANAM